MGRTRRRRISAAVAVIVAVALGLSGCATNSAPPLITGGAQGIFATTTQLSASSGTWAGVAPITYAYQWQDCNGPAPAQTGFACADVPGATAPTFTPTAADVGSYPRVSVTATDSGPNAAPGTAVSRPTPVAVQAPASSLQNEAAPTITPPSDPSNTEHVIVLTASPGAWTGGVPPYAYAYQWQDCNGADPNAPGFACSRASGDGGGASGPKFTPGAADVGSYLRVVVTASDSAPAPASATAGSAPTTSSVQAENLSTDLRCPAVGPSRGTLLYFHSGGFLLDITQDSADQICQQWARAGYNTVVVAYALRDLVTAEAQAEQEAAAATPPVFAIGESAGGTFAEWLAVHGRVSAAVSVAGISDLTTWGSASTWQVLGLSLAQRAALSPLQAVSGSAPPPAPIALFHSPTDAVVDYGQSVNLLNALRAVCGTCASLTNLTGAHLVDTSWQPDTVTWLASVLTAPAITTPDAATFSAGVTSSFTVRTSGTGPPSLSESGVLPAGITFTDNGDGTGTLAGATSTIGTFPTALTAHMSGQPDAVLPFTLTVAAAASSSPAPAPAARRTSPPRRVRRRATAPP